MLLLLCGPSNISRLIITVVVDTIYAMQLGWTGRHIGNEGTHVVPLIAHLNPPAAIVLVSLRLRVVASSNHSHPDRIQRVINQIMGNAANPLQATA